MKKKVISLTLIISILLIKIFISFDYSKARDINYYSKYNKPTFYGLTKAIIKTNTGFSLDNTKFRIFARDFEDGDLTQNIKVISNNVNTNEEGNYNIIYEVSDQDNNKTTINVPIEVKKDLTENYYERTLYTLPSVKNMTLSGTNRGNNHDREMLGFYMDNTSKIMVKNITNNTSLKLTYLNNDSNTEKEYTIKDEYVEISSEYSGVPFIKTLYETDEIKIAIKEINDTYELPYYHYKDSESNFFSKWNNINNSYALLESEDISILVPYNDKDKLLNYYSHCFNSLSSFFEYWKNVINTYDEYLGLSYNPESSIDQNVKTKYFVKANINGYGSAYYSNDHVGIHSSSVASFFEVNWGGLHEVAHGYQGSLANTLNQGEVSNNILGYYVQTDESITPYSLNWLGKISDIENNYQTNYDDLSLSGKLYFAINLLNLKDSKETYAEINKIWRRSIQNKEDINTIDAYILAFYNLYNINVSSYFEKYNLTVKESTKEKGSSGFIPSTINNITNNPNMIKENENKEGIYSLIEYNDLLKYDLKGNLNITLDINSIDELIGKKLIIQNGEYKYEYIINSNKINIKDIPIGTYQIILPVPKNNIYEYNKYNYVDISNKDTNITLSYNYENKLNLTNDYNISLLGLGNTLFANLKLNGNVIDIDINSISPHSYFSNTYAYINIYDELNNLVYSKDFIGNEKQTKENISINYKIGYRIEIFHIEGNSRLVIKDELLNEKNNYLITNNNELHVFYVGQYGLYQNDENEYNNYLKKIDKYILSIQNKYNNDKNNGTYEKRKLLLSINELKEEDKIIYLNKYKNLYNGENPHLNKDRIEIYNINELYNLLKGIDLEDDEFTLNENNFIIDLSNLNEVGTYKVKYQLYDLDNNVTEDYLTLTLKEDEIIIKEEIIENEINNEVFTNDNKTNKEEELEESVLKKEEIEENIVKTEVKNYKIKTIIIVVIVTSILSLIFIVYKTHFGK